MSFPNICASLCYRDGMISSEELAVFDVQNVGQSYYYHGQDIDQVNLFVVFHNRWDDITCRHIIHTCIAVQ